MSDSQHQTQTASDEDENETPCIRADFQKAEEDEDSPDITYFFADPDPNERYEFHFDPDMAFEQATNHGFVWTTPKEMEGVFVCTEGGS